MKTTYKKEQVEAVLDMVKSGTYGTWDNPDRSTSPKATFWQVAMGWRNSADFSNTILYPAAIAGEIWNQEMMKPVEAETVVNGSEQKIINRLYGIDQ